MRLRVAKKIVKLQTSGALQYPESKFQKASKIVARKAKKVGSENVK